MGIISDWFDMIGRYGRFKPTELRQVLITIAVIAFAISFNSWGPGNQFELLYGLRNFVGALIIVGISFSIRLYFQKIVSLGADNLAEYKMWSFGLLILVVVAMITKSNPWLWFLIPGGIVIHFMPGNRIGWVRYGLNFFGIGVISLAGPIANLVLAIIFRTLYEFTHANLFHLAFILNVAWALWSMVPIPPGDGSRIFFGSRPLYMFALGIVVSSSVLLLSNVNLLLTIIGSIVIAAVWWVIYYIVWERFNWKGPY